MNQIAMILELNPLLDSLLYYSEYFMCLSSKENAPFRQLPSLLHTYI